MINSIPDFIVSDPLRHSARPRENPLLWYHSHSALTLITFLRYVLVVTTNSERVAAT